jgi:hypothetical protein
MQPSFRFEKQAAMQSVSVCRRYQAITRPDCMLIVNNVQNIFPFFSLPAFRIILIDKSNQIGEAAFSATLTFDVVFLFHCPGRFFIIRSCFK